MGMFGKEHEYDCFTVDESNMSLLSEEEKKRIKIGNTMCRITDKKTQEVVGHSAGTLTEGSYMETSVKGSKGVVNAARELTLEKIKNAKR